MISRIDTLMLGATWLLIACNAPTGTDEEQRIVLPDTVTFAGHIAPIIWKNCMPCHRPGEAGPFPLITYANVRRRARTIRFVTGKRFMPPWPADTGYTHFVGERVLSARSIALIDKWVRQGALPGDTARLPPPPIFPADPSLGDPDLTVFLPDTFHVRGDSRDHFLIAKAPFQLERDTFVRAIAFIPGNRRLVHHMNGGLVEYADGAKRDPFAHAQYLDAEVVHGPEAFAELGLANDDGTFPVLSPNVVNYLPGLGPAYYPAGIGGWPLKREGAFLLNTLHYGPSPRDTTDRSRFLVWFAPGFPDRVLHEIQLGTLGLSPVEPPLHLMPGEVKTFHTSYTLPEDISVLTINPHMHLLGKEFLAYAVTPIGDTIPLIRIRDWDFRWQYAYTFTHPLSLVRGTVIHVSGTFDNTEKNPNQPFDPPHEVVGTESPFMRTTDEMFQFFINYVGHRSGDERINLVPAGPVPSSAAR